MFAVMKNDTKPDLVWQHGGARVNRLPRTTQSAEFDKSWCVNRCPVVIPLSIIYLSQTNALAYGLIVDTTSTASFGCVISRGRDSGWTGLEE
jgi:hypothetical protein